MTEYIDREVLKKMLSTEKFCATYPGLDEPGAGCAECVADYIESLPAVADVAPIDRGHWERDRDTIKCSECGFGMFPIRPAFRDGDCIPYSGAPNHCPDCGVRMEVEPHEQPESHY